MATVEEYKCPACGGAIAFDPGAQKLKCPYCGTEFALEDLVHYQTVLQEEKPDQMEWDPEGSEDWREEDKEGLHTYICHSCGGEIVTDEETVATSCPFCGNPLVLTEQVSGKLKPDLVVPFKIDRKAAKSALLRHYKGKKLLPRVFKDENHIDEIKGIYVPFWLFDTEAEGNARYKATRVRSWSDLDYNYVETQYFSVLRGGKMAFSNVPVDGSSKIVNEFMESIEPYNLEEAVDFQTAYLAGYFADRYDVEAKDCEGRANERIKRSTEEALASTVRGYAMVTPESCSVQFSGGKVRYALLPVWLLTTRWRDKTYSFVMNGQTGRFVGDLPVDNSLRIRYFLLSGTVGALAAIAVQAAVWLF